ncbi:MAG: hypothetical protein ACOX7D_02150 [Alphaproteobacteria bacterium]|jgi:hypothetical protein
MKKILISLFILFVILPISFANEPNKVNWDEPVLWQGKAVGLALKSINANDEQFTTFVNLFLNKQNNKKLTAMDMAHICIKVFAIGDDKGEATEADYNKCTTFVLNLVEEQNKIANFSKSKSSKIEFDSNMKIISSDSEPDKTLCEFASLEYNNLNTAITAATRSCCAKIRKVNPYSECNIRDQRYNHDNTTIFMCCSNKTIECKLNKSLTGCEIIQKNNL